jgi:hypothetical protein
MTETSNRTRPVGNYRPFLLGRVCRADFVGRIFSVDGWARSSLMNPAERNVSTLLVSVLDHHATA